MKRSLLASAALSALVVTTPAIAQSAPIGQAEFVSLLRAQAAEIAALVEDPLAGPRPAPHLGPRPLAHKAA